MSSSARESAAQKAEFAALIEAAKSRMHQVGFFFLFADFRLNHILHTHSTVSWTMFLQI